MNMTLISIEELKQIVLREIHTYPGCGCDNGKSAYAYVGCVAQHEGVTEGKGRDRRVRCEVRTSSSLVNRLVELGIKLPTRHAVEPSK